METSILVARLLALVYLTFALGILFSKDYYSEMLPKLIANSSAMLYGGLLALVLGFLILSHHNLWQSDWTIMITIIGWISVIKGILLVVFPSHISIYKNNILHPKNLTRLVLPVMLIIGLVFGYFGFVKYGFG